MQNAQSTQIQPEMSVVIVADRFENIRKTVRHLTAQNVAKVLELVIVTQSNGTLDLDEKATSDFCKLQIVEVETLFSLARALAAGIRRSGAAIIAIAESHSYPGPGWAEALIERHKQPFAAVAPVITNANPRSIISWANLFLDYGRCVEPRQTGIAEFLPGHNSSYKREILLQYDSQLDDMMVSEILLHWDMRARGHQLFIEGAAKTYHLNITNWRAWLPERLFTGRRFAATRSRDWSGLTRLLYFCGSPLIPFVRLPRVVTDIRRSHRRRELLPRILPALTAGLFASAVGEMIGYAAGAGTASEQLARMEINKVPHVTKRDRLSLETWPPVDQR